MIQEIRENEDGIIFVLSGKIYADEATILREKILEYLENSNQHIICDLTGVTYIDSAGLGVLVAVHKRTKENNRTLIIKGLNGMVKEMFELTRLTKVFTIQ
ncbi:STAS domain-containing protein [Bacillus tianshenii]|nr:STAS domain-containing protein [Bacillus tianshenii]